mgnify:FL=1
MSTTATVETPPEQIYKTRDSEEHVLLSVIDRSMRTPALFFILSAVAWLMIGTVFALIAAFKAHSPHFMAESAVWTFGRVRSAHLNAMIYGWSNNVIFAVGLWMMARLCKAEVRHGGMLIIAGIFWNLAVTVGIFGILAGDLTSVEWQEMPLYATPLMAVSYAMIAIWGILAFRYRKGDHVYVSQWYILGALFWFPWLFFIAQVMILFAPAQGTVQSITNWWFAHNVLGLWLTPMGLAAAYYLIPKVLGRPIHSYYLSILGFWSLALFYNWAGVHHLIGGPIPVWLQTAGIVGSVMMVIPVVVTAINHHFTVVGHVMDVWRSPTLRFVVFGAISYTAVSLIGSLMALRDVNVVTHFTHFTVGHAHHGVYAFFTMVMYGAVYFIMPRMLYREWPSAAMIRVHFWCTALGIGMMVVALSVGGWIQGLQMNAMNENGLPAYSFLEVMENTVPWLVARSMSGMLLTIGHIAFGINVLTMILRRDPEASTSGPTLLGKETA